MLKEECKIKGIVTLILKDKDGKVKQHKTIRNAVTEYGLAHIIGRLIDTNQDFNESHTIPRMISHMAIGTGTAHAANTVDRMLEEEVGYRVQVMKDSSTVSDYDGTGYTGAVESISGHPIAPPGGTLDGSVDYGTTRGKVGAYYDSNNRLSPPYVENPPAGYSQFGTSSDGVFQGKVITNSVTIDSGTTPEGYPTNENDYGQVTNPAEGTAVAGTKKSGTRVVYVATFKGRNPDLGDTTPITEAGLFNRSAPDLVGTFDTTKGDGTLVTDTQGNQVYIEKAGYTGGDISQTMLCRTTFDPINKDSTDTLQVTWSVQLSDQSS